MDSNIPQSNRDRPPAVPEANSLNRNADSYLFETNRTLFREIIENDIRTDGQSYRDRIRNMIESGGRRLILNVNELRTARPEETARLMTHPLEYIARFEMAMRETIRDVLRESMMQSGKEVSRAAVSATLMDTTLMTEIDPMELEEDENLVGSTRPLDEYMIGFEGMLGSHHVTPRGLSVRLIRSLVCVEGIATQCSIVRPRVVRSVHFCKNTKKYETHFHSDPVVSLRPVSSTPESLSYPMADRDGNPMATEFGWSTYKDSQRVVLQEMPERAPAGQLPRSVEVILEHELVDGVKPGDRVRVYGIYRALNTSRNSYSYRTLLVATHISQLSSDLYGSRITEADISNIREEATKPGLFERLSRSVAPSIFGHEFVKRAILLQLLGGMEHNLANGTHIRGDVNILLVGDPSTAKSQLLRFVLNAAPLAISTSGRGSSGVGLTAAVVSDKDTGDRRLEAGAMVLADRGVVCIDEFDKMSVEDRVAIHEVMEQQTVTISKAGIHASLNARCSVLAASNPVYGQYDRSKPPAQNIRLPDSLLSRFDLLFIVLDNLNANHDRKIAGHVLKMHRYRGAGGESNIRAGAAQGDALFAGGGASIHGVNALGLLNPGWQGISPLEEAAMEVDQDDENGASLVYQRQPAKSSRTTIANRQRVNRSALLDGISTIENEEEAGTKDADVTDDFGWGQADTSEYVQQGEEEDRRLDDGSDASHRDRTTQGRPVAADESNVENEEEEDNTLVYTSGFLKKYIVYARKFHRPTLSDAASEWISNSWAELRKPQESSRTLPITARTLETLIRLSVAHAKLRLSNTVSEDDAKVATDVLNYALFHQTAEVSRTSTTPVAPLSARKQPRLSDSALSPSHERENLDGSVSVVAATKSVWSIEDVMQAISSLTTKTRSRQTSVRAIANELGASDSVGYTRVATLIQDLHNNQRILLDDADIHLL